MSRRRAGRGKAVTGFGAFTIGQEHLANSRQLALARQIAPR